MTVSTDHKISVSRILISGAGFLADAYDLFVINIAVDLMSRVDYKQELTNSLKSNVKTMALVGAIVGQIGFGATADLIGRRKIFIATCSMVIIGAILSATAVDTSTFGLYSQLCLWRFVLGVGVGGEYPLSASITAESSDGANVAKSLALVFSMQGLGVLLCSIVLIIVTQSMGTDYNAQWRVALAMGAFPMVCAFYFRWKMHETSWKEEAKSNLQLISNAVTDDLQNHQTRRSSLRYAPKVDTALTYFYEGSIAVGKTVHANRWQLTGTAGSWLILDIVFYANGLFSGQVTEAMGIAKSPKGEAFASLILNLIALPGYFCTVAFIDRIGPTRLQLNGFAATGIFFSLLAILQPYLIQIPGLYVFLYGVTFFFQNFGANATTYIIPSIIYPTSQRATCHGISAAAGKLGAIFGAETFLYLVGSFCRGGTCTDDASSSDVDRGLQLTFGVCAILAFAGLIWSYVFVQMPEKTNDSMHRQPTEILMQSKTVGSSFETQNPLFEE